MKNAAIKIVENLAQLVKVKTLVTLVLTAVFAVLAVRGNINPEQFLTVFTVVVSFYFVTQYERGNSVSVLKSETNTETEKG